MTETHSDEQVRPAQIAVETFNDLNPVGVRVRYWPGALVGEGVESVTRSAAWLLGGHTPVVMVEGYAGGIALSHVIARPTPIRGDKSGEGTP